MRSMLHQVLALTPSRTRTAAVTMVALLMATTVSFIAPAVNAQDAGTVPTKPSIVLEPMPNLRQFFFARYDTTGGQPICTDPPQQPTARRLGLAPATETDSQPRDECRYVAEENVGGATGQQSIAFDLPTDLHPRRRVSLTGNNSFNYHHEGTIPTGVELTVTIQTGSQTIASSTISGDGSSDYNLKVILAGPTANTGRVFLEPNVTMRLILTARALTSDPTGAGVALPQQLTWSIDDTNTFLELRADDAIRAATWVTDERDVLRDVFAPIANESLLPTDRDRRFVGHFALQSAFGTADAGGDAPTFTVLYQNRPAVIGPGGQTIIEGNRNESATIASAGVVVWSFPTGTVNYRGFQSGQYTLRVEKNHLHGSPITSGHVKSFSITSQSVRLEPYADPRVGGLTETQSHVVAPGSTTTYILAVNNTGSVHDNFTINLTAPNAPAGWGAAIGGPDVLSRRVFVPAGETRVFTVTVSAPFAASGQVIHLVNVTSMIDPGARSRDLTLVTTVGTDVVREVGVVFLARDTALEPGVETHFPVYVWNRGTRPANISLEIQEASIAGWIADLAFGNSNVDRIVLSGIQPGDIAEARLEVTGPLSAAVPTHPITLNATHLDASGISSERVVTFTLRSLPGVSLQVLNQVGARAHLAQLTASNVVTRFPPVAGQGTVPDDTRANPACTPGGCDEDGVQGLWHRVWITNTGRSTDSFDLSADTLRSNCDREGNNVRPPVFPETGLTSDFGFFFRSPSGVPSRVSVVEIPPGRTAEVYVYVPVRTENTPCTTTDNSPTETFDFVIEARGRASGAIGRHAISNAATDNDNQLFNGVYLEGVVRDASYSQGAPFVDVQNATKRTIVGAVEPGRNLTYYVRMTNAASWSEFVDDGTRQAPDLRVTLSGVKHEEGWNVSIRPVFDASVNDLQRNPYSDQYNLTNVNGAVTPPRREAWIDRELEVVVQPPSIENGTAVAGLRHEFQILAGTNTTNDQSTLVVATIVADLANITARTDVPRVFAHPGEPGTLLLYVANNGSAEADIRVRASIEGTPNAASWQVNPGAERIQLPAYKNRTLAILVTPPAGSTQGATSELNVTIEYPRLRQLPNATTNLTLRIPTEVVAPGTLQLTTPTTTATIGQGGTANYTMTIRNTGSLSTPFRATATPIPNWSVTVSPEQGTLNPGESRTVVLVLIAPPDVTDQSRYASVVRVEESGAANNFDTAAFHVNIQGGQAIPRIFVPNLVKRVDRAGVQNFEVQISNAGSAFGRIPLEVRSSDPSWTLGIVNQAGQPITSVDLQPNQLVNVNVTVRAPFMVPERTVTPFEIIAYSPDQTLSQKQTLTAEIHDFGVSMQILPSSKDALPGLPTEFTVRIRNTGNDNDTLNVSVNLIDLPEWSVQLSSEEIRLEPNQEQEIRATIRSPTGPLPTPRAYTFPFWIGTRGGQEVNITKNMTAPAVITIPNYRAYDVDRDSQLEIAVDLDKRQANGFEEFRDIFNEGVVTQVVAKGTFEGRTTFFLDIPRDRPYDGVADIWFNPETVYAFEIRHAPDVNGDGTPDYLLDVDREGKIDRAFDTATERFWDALEVKVFGDDRIQYLVDISGDGKPDRFYDPETAKVTRTQNADDVGRQFVGIDVDDDDRVDYYYNTETKETSGAEVSNLGDFARDNWYFFLAFVALVVLTVLLIVRRRK